MLKREMKKLYESMDEIFSIKSQRDDPLEVITMIEAVSAGRAVSPYLNGVIYEFPGQFTTIVKLELEGYTAGYYEYQVRFLRNIVLAISKTGNNTYGYSGASLEQVNAFLEIFKEVGYSLYGLPFDPLTEIFNIYLDDYPKKQ